MPKNQETYLKNAYEFIYGKEGEQLCKKKMDVKTKPSEKKKINVKFSESIEYSRN